MDYGNTACEVCVGSTSVRQWPVCGFCWQTPPFFSRARDENDGLDPKERSQKKIEKGEVCVCEGGGGEGESIMLVKISCGSLMDTQIHCVDFANSRY